jgi:hypothetical protein
VQWCTTLFVCATKMRIHEKKQSYAIRKSLVGSPAIHHHPGSPNK